MSDVSASSKFVVATVRPVRAAELNRLLRRFFGVCFALAAIGLWLVPGSNWDANVMLIKTGFTAILCFSAIACILPRRD